MIDIFEGCLEPHAPLLKMPSAGTKVYKVLSIENFLRSITGNYLHFTRMDEFQDDELDGIQLPTERKTNQETHFENKSEFTLEKYYSQARSRSYAFCASLENSQYVWENYGCGDRNGKVCLEFHVEKLRSHINYGFSNWSLSAPDCRCVQIISLNYGLVKYVSLPAHVRSSQYSANPIEYAYLKELRFKKEREFRIVLSALGIGYSMVDKLLIGFPTSLAAPFDFRKAFQDKVISSVHVLPGSDIKYLSMEMSKLGIEAIIV